MGEIFICAAAAMVGAGFASGQEIMRFFSCHGAFSWGLIFFSAFVTALMVWRMLSGKARESAIGKSMHSLFYLAVGGGMTAAAGELWALTVPLPCARIAGSVVTLTVCLRLAGGSYKSMAWLGKALLPLLLAVLVLCLRVPGSAPREDHVAWQEKVFAMISAAGYCGLNGMTAAGVLRGSWPRKDRNGISLGIGLLTAVLLGLGNAALLSHAEMLKDAPLPTVILLRTYGKAGYYLAASTLYLAAATTLIAVLRGLMAITAQYLPNMSRFFIGLVVWAVSLLGFQDIVGAAYPALGGIYLTMLTFPSRKKNRSTADPFSRSSMS